MLDTHGYIVIPSPIDVASVRKDLQDEVDSFTEYRVSNNDTNILGGFSAYGNPSSFHNLTVRFLRQDLHSIVKNALQPYSQADDLFEQIIDRILIRPAGRRPSPESWHRDIAPDTNPNDRVFGGWINLDDKDQTFSCVPGTHNDPINYKTTGFAKIEPSDKAYYQKHKTKVKIPPGHILVFDERLIHEVFPKAFKYTSYRLFMGWRITKSTQPLIPDLEQRLEDQAVMPLKSGQMPRIYPKLYWTNWCDKLIPLKRVFRSKTTALYTMASGKHKGRCFRLPHPNTASKTQKAHMHSLRKLRQLNPKVKLYRGYIKREKDILRPQPFH